MSYVLGESKERLKILRDLLREGTLSTQDELCEKLEKKGLSVTQSTVSRDLRKVGAVKVLDPEGRTVYRLAEEEFEPVTVSTSFNDLVHSIDCNDSLIVIRTSVGSASLVARHLDRSQPGDILGTLAGDDTIFVAPGKKKSTHATLKILRQTFGLA